VTGAETRRRLTALHREVDDRVAGLTAALPGTLVCQRGCVDCCVDDMTVFSVESDLIRHHHHRFLATATAHPVGACAFLGADGGCRIYRQRPYVCRTQGLPLRWQTENDAGRIVEMRDICPLNEPSLGTALVELAPQQCWHLGEFEGRLASLAAEAQGEFVSARESLRGLFAERQGGA